MNNDLKTGGLFRYSDKELGEIRSDRAYWQEFADAFGWQLLSWRDRSLAEYQTGKLTLEITGMHRDAILKRINRPKVTK